ncbi:ABC transporter ATP-binding protein [Glycomyces harbinensis]|uniref:ABC-2 type transport system ATP-binding protein n=1 Tax=Glycomyces harbinensis TaxID=58114 RepID=A0A1G7DEH3_9ACTN|nr:ATP-binding cassette domain-containing protein [Glycomyces harbinensis]SDE49205.1 ABC-2 type transport system ATP-binding protein [Glycomyces harbinensis]
MSDPILVARGLTKRYGARAVVDDLSFEVAAGAVTALLGPNGAGKTTLLRMVLGLSRPTSGDVLLEGSPYRELPNPSSVVGALLDDHGFHPDRSAYDHLRIMAAANRIERSRCDAVLESVALAERARDRVRTYSLGMRQRLGLAAAMLGEPRMLILDEPMNGLDPEGMHWLRGYLRDFASGGGAVLVSSHVLSEVEQFADEVLIVDRGRKIAAGALSDVVEESSTLERTLLALTGSGETRP